MLFQLATVSNSIELKRTFDPSLLLSIRILMCTRGIMRYVVQILNISPRVISSKFQINKISVTDGSILFVSEFCLFIYECENFFMFLQDLTSSSLSAFSHSHTGKNTNEVILTFSHSLSISMKSFDYEI